MHDLLTLSADLPEVDLAVGDVLVQEGTTTGAIWVLVSGSLEVLKGDVSISTIDRPGAVVGEMAVLLGPGHSASATVRAASSCRVRHAIDGQAFLERHPDILFEVAAGLAGRLELVTAYLADLRRQYSDAPGLQMVSEVLGKLTQQQGPAARPGSAREPDPEY